MEILYNIIILGLVYIIYRMRIKGISDIEKARKDSLQRSKSVIRGKVSEEFIPLFPDFPYELSDCKFSGQPIDFIVFKNMSKVRDGEDAEIEIIIADVKVNKSKRTKVQNAIKKAIENKNFRFETWQIDENKKINLVN
jgi:predicted Holliday junction resolvase-like endonuclease